MVSRTLIQKVDDLSDSVCRKTARGGSRMATIVRPSFLLPLPMLVMRLLTG